MQKVKIYLQLCGVYVAFHEITVRVLYDVTNDIMLDDSDMYESLADIKKASKNERDYCDIKLVDAIKTEDGKYFYQI